MWFICRCYTYNFHLEQIMLIIFIWKLHILHKTFISIDSYGHINIYIFVMIPVIYLLNTKEIFFALFWPYASIVGRCYNTTVWYSDKNHSFSLLKICISTRYIHIWVSGYKYRQSETLKINNYQRFIKRFVGLSV
jgi:hypothetical protein